MCGGQQCGGQAHKVHQTTYLNLVLTTSPHLKFAATLPCNLSSIAYFMTLMFHKVVWQHVLRVVGHLVIFTANLLENQLVKEFGKSVKN